MSQVVRDTGLTAADAWAIADDRSTWRALRPIAGYAQQWVRSFYWPDVIPVANQQPQSGERVTPCISHL